MQFVLDGPLDQARERVARQLAVQASESDPVYATKHYREQAGELVLAALGLEPEAD